MPRRMDPTLGWSMPIPARRKSLSFFPGPEWMALIRSRGLILTLLATLLAACAFAGTSYEYSTVPLPVATGSALDEENPVPRPEREETIRRLRRQLTGLSVGKNYIVVDQANNRLYLRRGEDLLHEAICSSGSGYVLREGEAGRTWVFDSPRGDFQVRTRIDKPVWKKPDWAFVEAGEPVPQDPSKRFEYGVLGEHALYFGNGFMIHGTLYERLLGRSVTHGCIRLGRDDLRRVYDASPVGTPIYIY